MGMRINYIVQPNPGWAPYQRAFKMAYMVLQITMIDRDPWNWSKGHERVLMGFPLSE
ncbi:hypothetical protein FH972_018907 [Carpinus fangiana]|uniref:Uncharacterized protein n=1 Tax=Carpinus fangiana TaxID=176857 RepID=A0A5N6RNT3_9ROSI|nr:hypothetical protein FH972_018907 [Carpinus fangiana]